MGSLPLAKASVGSAVNDATRTTGGALGVAVLGSLLSSGYRGDMDGAVAGSAARRTPRATRWPARSPWRRAADGAQLAATAQQAFVNGMHTAVVVAAAIALAGALVALVFLPGRARAARPSAARAGAAGRMTRACSDDDAARRRPGGPAPPRPTRRSCARRSSSSLEVGYRGLTMEQVRARAGVGKATLYRRYGSKEELVTEAIRHLNQPIDRPDTGSVRADILASPGRCWRAPSASGSRASSRACSPSRPATPRCTRSSTRTSSPRGGR